VTRTFKVILPIQSPESFVTKTKAGMTGPMKRIIR
jgi:hypothetical protein